MPTSREGPQLIQSCWENHASQQAMDRTRQEHSTAGTCWPEHAPIFCPRVLHLDLGFGLSLSGIVHIYIRVNMKTRWMSQTSVVMFS